MATAGVKSEGAHRTAGFAFIAWVSMVGILVVMAAVKWNQPGFRDPDITSPFEMAFLFAVVSAIPFALVSVCVLAPSSVAADRIVRGRLGLGPNVVIGALFSIPATLAFFVGNWRLFDRKRALGESLARARNIPDSVVALLLIFAVGGVIVSLGMRRRPWGFADCKQPIADSR